MTATETPPMEAQEGSDQATSTHFPIIITFLQGMHMIYSTNSSPNSIAILMTNSLVVEEVEGEEETDMLRAVEAL